MSKTRMAVLLAVAVMAFAAAPALALTWGGEVFGSFDTHSMSDWNDQIVNPIKASGGSMDDFGNGWGGGLGLRFWTSPNLMLAATWEPIFQSRKEDITGIKFEPNANSYQATAAYFFPSTGKAKYGIGGGIGYYSISGKISGAGDPNIDGDLSGTTVGFHFMGTGEWTVSPGFAITGTAGYRIAKVSDTKLDDQSSSPEFATDYSGLMLRAGLAFYMPSSSK